MLMNNDSMCICLGCNDLVPWREVEAADTKARGHRRYICPSCREKQKLGTDNTQEFHKEKKHGFSFQLVLQGIPKDEICYNAMQSALYGVVSTGKSNRRSINYVTPIYNNGSGVKAILRSFIDYNDFSNPAFNMYVNLMHEDFTNDETLKILNTYKNQIFGTLEKIMENDPESTVKVFGQKFNGSNWLEFKNNTVTLKMGKIVNANQFYHIVCFLKELVKTVNTNFIKYMGTDKEVHKMGITSGKLVTMFYKYAEGKAECQLEKYNSRG